MTRKETNRFDQISRTIQRNQTVLPFQTFFKQNPNSKDRRETKINSTFFHFRSPQTWNNNLPHGIVYLDKSQNLNPAQEIALIPHVYTHIYHNSMENRSLINPHCRKRISDGQSRREAVGTGGTGWKKPHGFPGGRRASKEFADICERVSTLNSIRCSQTRAARRLYCAQRGGLAGQPGTCIPTVWWINDMFSNSASRCATRGHTRGRKGGLGKHGAGWINGERKFARLISPISFHQHNRK